MKRPTVDRFEIIEPYEGREFTVTEDDVRGSRVADHEECAAARACSRLPGIKKAWIFRTRTVLLRDDGVAERYKNPASLKRTIEGFDKTAGFFPPGVYKLNPINNGSRMERRKILNTNNPKRENKGVRPHLQPRHRPGYVIR